MNSRLEQKIHSPTSISGATLRPDYDDAMAYMNLLYRERASLQFRDHGSYAKDLDTADKWVDLTMMTKKKKMETQRLKNDQ